MTSGPALSKPADLLPFLTNATEGSFLFIDEIHRLPRVVEEFIYPAMEDFRVDIVLGEGINARTLSIPLKRFTLIGATTRSGMLTAILLALARVAGETAPLLFTAFGNRYWSSGWNQPTASLPVMIFTYAVSPYEDWHRQAWAAGLVLLGLILIINILARTILSRGIAVPRS